VEWRVEADDEWLSRHRSDNFQRLRRRMSMFGVLGGAMSEAELGPFGGAPRRPKLSIGGKAYAVVRYAHHRMAYTAIQIDPTTCRRCGRPLAEVHRIVYARGSARSEVGVVRSCRSCQADSWMFWSRMPSTSRARRVSRKVVL